jgi:hypothetical protein
MSTTFSANLISIVNSSALAGSLALIVILVLVALLIQKELTTGAEGRRVQTPNWKRVLNIGIGPLLIAFVLIVAAKIIELLN